MSIILLLWLLVGALDEVASCVDNVPASNEWMPDLGYRLQAHRYNGLLAVMPNYTFSCEGVVKQWIVQWYLVASDLSGCEFLFDFHVLRPTGSCSVTSIGKNRIAVKAGVVTDSIFNISDSERIQVREGDMVGLAVTYNWAYVSSCFFSRLTIAEQDDTYSLLTNEVHYIQGSFAPDSITELDLECNREHRDDDDDDSIKSYTYTRDHRDDDNDDFTTPHNYTGEYRDDDDDDGTDDDDESTSKTTKDRSNFKGTDFHVYYATPLINAVVESTGVQPTTPSETESTAFSETGKIPSRSSDPKTQDGEQEPESNMMIPVSVVAATIGGLLIATTGVITILCVCYCFRKRKKTGGQPEFAVSENKAYSLQPSPTYDYYDDIKCVNPTYENGEDNEYINMRPAKGIAVDQKKPLRPPRQYSMKHNTAYGASSLPNTSTATPTAATIAEELSRRSYKSQTPTASVGKYAGNCFIVEDSVYEVPNPLQ